MLLSTDAYLRPGDEQLVTFKCVFCPFLIQILTSVLLMRMFVVKEYALIFHLVFTTIVSVTMDIE